MKDSIVPLFHGAQKKTLFTFRRKSHTTLERGGDGRLSAPPQPLTPTSCFANKPKLPDFPTAAASLPGSHMAQAPQPSVQPRHPASSHQYRHSGRSSLPEQDKERGGMLQHLTAGGLVPSPGCPLQDFGRRGFSPRSPRALRSARVPPLQLINARLIPQGAAGFHLPRNLVLTRRGVPDGKRI